MVEITIDLPATDSIAHKKKRNLVVVASIVASVFVLLTSFLLFYFLYLKDYLHQKYLEEVNNGFTNYLESNGSGKLDKNLIYKKMTYYAVKMNKKIIKGSFEKCMGDRYKNPTGDYVHDWKLKSISELLEGRDSLDLDDEFDTIKKNNEFMTKFNIKYSDTNNFKPSYNIFRKNKKLIEEHNKNPDRLYNLDYNYFADYAEESGTTTNLPNRKLDEKYQRMSSGIKDLADQEIHVDWREKGVISDVIMQGTCGSCWAIASADAFNAFMSIKKNKKLTFSYQQVLECSSSDFGCKGGIHRLALEYIKKTPMCTNEEYPYRPEKGKCNTSKCSVPAEFNEVRNLTVDTALDYLKNNGPFITSIKTTNRFMLYGDGIYNSGCRSNSGHSVLVVGHGYDKVKKVNYWIVKNSWGLDWGEDGYVRVLDVVRDDQGVKETHCDFLTSAYGIF